MQVTVKYYGQLQDFSGCDSEKVSDVNSSDSLLTKLIEMHPLLHGKQFTLAVNTTIIRGNQQLDDGAVVILMPPFSGG
ncbi:hypothetical protein BH09BAC5_BH09BAC5_27730 [soil metagenome]